MRRAFRAAKNSPSTSPLATTQQLNLELLMKPLPHASWPLEELVAEFPLSREGNPFPHSLSLALLLVDGERRGALRRDEVETIYFLHGVINETPSTPSAYQWNRAARSCYHYSISELLRETQRSGMDQEDDVSAAALREIQELLESVLKRLGNSSLGTTPLGDYPSKMGSAPGSISDTYDQWLYPIFHEDLVAYWTGIVMGARGAGLDRLLPLLRRVKDALTEDEDVAAALFRLRGKEPTALAMMHFLSLVEEYNLEWALAAMEWSQEFKELPALYVSS